MELSSLHGAPHINDSFVGPLIFSANTGSSLPANVKAFAEHIKANPGINLKDLAWTLHAKRTTSFPVKTFFSGATRQRLLDFMDRFVADSESCGADSTVGTRAHPINGNELRGILGVFTGKPSFKKTIAHTLTRNS